jgi:hypothetical protein
MRLLAARSSFFAFVHTTYHLFIPSIINENDHFIKSKDVSGRKTIEWPTHSEESLKSEIVNSYNVKSGKEKVFHDIRFAISDLWDKASKDGH